MCEQVNPKPEVRDLVKEREWRARMGRTDTSKHITIVDDIAQTEDVFQEKVVVFEFPG